MATDIFNISRIYISRLCQTVREEKGRIPMECLGFSFLVLVICIKQKDVVRHAYAAGYFLIYKYIVYNSI